MINSASQTTVYDWSVDTNYPRTPAFRVVQPRFPGSGVLNTIVETDDEQHARLIAAAPDMARTIRYARLALWDLVKHLPENAPERTALAMMDGCIGKIEVSK